MTERRSRPTTSIRRICALPVVQVVKNGYVTNSDYYTWEVTATRRQSNRWSLLASFSNMWSRQGFVRLTPNALINTTDGRDAYNEWQVRLSSNLQLWKGIEVTPMLRAQAGRPYAPTFIARLNYNTNVPIKASPRGEQRNDDVAVFDIRVAKTFAFSARNVASRLRRRLQHVQHQRGPGHDGELRREFPEAVADQRTADRALRPAIRVLARRSHGHERRTRAQFRCAGAG